MQIESVDPEIRRVVFAKDRQGECPAREFLEELDRSNDKKDRSSLARFDRSFRWIDQGGRLTDQHFKKLAGNIWEFRVMGKTPRILCFMEAGLYVLTHGIIKKQDKVPKNEIERAERIRQECLEGG